MAVVIKDIVLPDRETVSLRPTFEPVKSKGKDFYSVAQTAVESAPTFGVVLPMAVLMKGQEKVYPGVISLITVYMNGPLALRALATLPYKGPAQVFFKNEDSGSAAMFVGTDFVGQLSDFLVIELQPGKYSFSTDKAEEPLQLDLLNDHQYWVERRHRAFIAEDPERHEEEIKKLANDPEILVKNLIQKP